MGYFDAYPLYLKAADIMDILQVSKTVAYDMMNENGFPLLRCGKSGKSKRVHRDKFFEWLMAKESKTVSAKAQ